jgi:hypothetical protein
VYLPAQQAQSGSPRAPRCRRTAALIKTRYLSSVNHPMR